MCIHEILPGLLLCVPISAQYTDVLEIARQRDRAGIEVVTGQRERAIPDGKVPRAEYHPDFPDDGKGEVTGAVGRAGEISKGRLAHKPPKGARKEFDQGVRARRKGRLSDALQRFAEAVRLDPNYLEALSELGELRLRNGEASQALESLERAVAIDGGYSSLHANEALALLLLGRPAEAETAARRAVRLAPRSEAAHCALGLALLNQGRVTQETEEHLAIAAGRFPDVRERLAWVQERLSSSPTAQH